MNLHIDNRTLADRPGAQISVRVDQSRTSRSGFQEVIDQGDPGDTIFQNLITVASLQPDAKRDVAITFRLSNSGGETEARHHRRRRVPGRGATREHRRRFGIVHHVARRRRHEHAEPDRQEALGRVRRPSRRQPDHAPQRRRRPEGRRLDEDRRPARQDRDAARREPGPADVARAESGNRSGVAPARAPRPRHHAVVRRRSDRSSPGRAPRSCRARTCRSTRPPSTRPGSGPI